MNKSEIAIIGMSCRFPGVDNIESFWQNLRDGVESITFFSDEELLSAGIAPALLEKPHYIKAKGILSDIELFDASFFGFSPGEAEILDPQHRLFLEEAWKALEHAGYNTETYQESIGIYAGASMNTYLAKCLYPNLDLIDPAANYQVMIGNDKDFLPTRVSYKLNLRGPSVNIQTACSTSLTAVHIACQSLLHGECDMALAGCISLRIPHKSGYLYQENMILSPDGHCRAFDARAQGTVSGNGVGIVVLKRMEDAIKDGDCIQAIIKGSAVNNDGSLKIGYTAPSVEGQREVILEAQAIAGINSETITYIEAHGTGTVLGDPIEIRALTQAFREHTWNKGFCAIGSVKTNVGHLDVTAGMAGLIKTVLAMKHKLLPPSLNFEHPNPKIDFNNSPFYVNSSLTEWNTDGFPRRAGVSSFGIGGTNAHVILEEAPHREPSGPSRPSQLLILSAKTTSALDTATANLTEYLTLHPELNLADIAYTLQSGRRAFTHRRMAVCRKHDDAVTALNLCDSTQLPASIDESDKHPIVFMFPGQGAQYVNMARGLYETEPTFRNQVDFCSERLNFFMGIDLRHVLYPVREQTEEATRHLQQTAITQPALFVIEYALAQLWMEWGIHPHAMIGHSIGEYAAACLAGVFSLEDALLLVAKRGQMMQQLPKGAMLAVLLPEKDLQPLLSQGLSLAAINAPSLCVISGPTLAIEALQHDLVKQGVEFRHLHTSHAFHSEMMDPVSESFTECVRRISLNPPQIPYISNVNGDWITPSDAVNPDYWARHLRKTVRFSDGVRNLLSNPDHILLEVGPGRTLTTFAMRHPHTANRIVLSSIRHPQDSQSDTGFLLTTLGKLWLSGVKINWSGFYAHEQRYRIPLPAYPFERQRYWIDSPGSQSPTAFRQQPSDKKRDIADWFYVPSWKRSPLPISGFLGSESSVILMFVDECGLGNELTKRLRQDGRDIIMVKAGTEFARLNESVYTLNPGMYDDYNTLINEIIAQHKIPKTIIHLWGVTPEISDFRFPISEGEGSEAEILKSKIRRFENAQDSGFYSLLFLTQTIRKQNTIDAAQIIIVSNNMHEVGGEDFLYPEKATILGLVNVIPQEYSNISCRSIDVVVPKSESKTAQKLTDHLLAEISTVTSDPVIAYRWNYRWVRTFEPLRIEAADKQPAIRNQPPGAPFREEGVYLIIGGLGGIGSEISKYLARTVKANLVLIGRTKLPGKDEWDKWLSGDGIRNNITDKKEEQRIQKKLETLKVLESLGAEVLVINADVSDIDQMKSAIHQAQKRFGQIHGVIHAAGTVVGSMIQLMNRELAVREFTEKAIGTLVIDTLIKDIPLDFFVLCSSTASIIGGGLGLAGYSAANAFLDAYAHLSQSKHHAVAIDWDRWQSIGMAVGIEVRHKVFLGKNLHEGIMSEEGLEALSRILQENGRFPQVLVSKRDFQNLPEARRSAFLLTHTMKFKPSGHAEHRHPRPELGSIYAPPRNDIEKKLTDIWQEVLGIDKIGIRDNFFNLGGDSLIATQVISRIQESFNVGLKLATLFEEPTVAGAAERITLILNSTVKMNNQ